MTVERAPDPGRRARRRDQTRDRLFDAALALLTERGYKATTMDAIAGRADVARGTVFNHFPEKVAFLEEWGRRRRAYVSDLITDEPDARDSASHALRRYLHEMAVLNVESREQTVVLMDASARYGALLADTALADALTGLVERGREAGEFRGDSPAGEIGALLANVYFTAVLQWVVTEPPPFDLASRIDSLVDVVVRGITVSTP